ncbi:UNVERIFIED_CONTAM: hypothetical protein PYX00_002977 [Menopon gallinae]|uniref:Uncharacterized protein n=1 Tax=Menopon gallinae TaxID=328185 RepID=A0AAW2HY34_9NEOP
MLQISNLDEGKADWINETQLIIPMVDSEELQTKEIDGMEKHTITLNALDGTDQTLLTNVNGHTFVIGLDRALFENYNSKSDLLLMPNSDLKLLPTVPDCKLTYNLPPIDQGKNDIIWENNTFEKPLTKDILNVIQDTSKSWNELDKNNELCLEDIGVHENKMNSDFLIEPHLVNQSKKIRNDTTEYVVGYYPMTETCDTVLVPASLMTLPQKPVESEKGVIIDNENSKNLLFVTDNIEDTQSEKWIKSNLVTHTSTLVTDKLNSKGRISVLKTGNTPDNSMLLTHESINKLKETVIPLIDSANGDFIEAKPKNDIYNEMEKCITKDEKCDFKGLENENGALPEQSLPLKKKAKMKNSPVNGSFNLSSIDNIQGFNMIQTFWGVQSNLGKKRRQAGWKVITTVPAIQTSLSQVKSKGKTMRETISKRKERQLTASIIS